MFDKTGQWIHLETFDEFDNGLSDLIELWSSTAAQSDKDKALVYKRNRFCTDLDSFLHTLKGWFVVNWRGGWGLN